MIEGNKARTVTFEESPAAIPQGQAPSFARERTITFGVLALLLLVCYYPMLAMTAKVIALGDDMAYGFFAPLVAAFVVWNDRSYLVRPEAAASPWSLVFAGIGACIGTVSTLANSSTFSRVGFLLSLVGCLLWAGGGRALRRFIFPLGLLLFTFPIPDVLYGEITQPLQLLASRLSESAFEVLGISVVREGNVLQLPYMSLSVVEACSGLRSLITLGFFCLVYSYFFESRLWVRAGVVLMAIPSAIFVNVLRITATGVLGKYNQAWTQGTVHEVVGWTAFALGFGLVLGGHLVACRALGSRPDGGVLRPAQ
jgi:exosortase